VHESLKLPERLQHGRKLLSILNFARKQRNPDTLLTFTI
jgi:hypothetical protein